MYGAAVSKLDMRGRAQTRVRTAPTGRSVKPARGSAAGGTKGTLGRTAPHRGSAL
jgi:hypothetical protein